MHLLYIVFSIFLVPVSIYRIYKHIYGHSNDSATKKDVSPTKKHTAEPHTTPSTDIHIIERQNQLLWALQNASEGYTPNSAKIRGEKILSIFSGTPNESEYLRLEMYRDLVDQVAISAGEIFSLLEHGAISESTCIQDTRMLARRSNLIREQLDALQERMQTLEPIFRVAKQRIQIAEEDHLNEAKEIDAFKRITLGQRHAAAMMLHQLEHEIRILEEKIDKQ
eukprot:TRINITY_DN9026_c0_g1_i1.p1 TRINITY_DN9026_c0_g1~~TRINITY_DN9026_c0_g1_i1.p1  ORF type:complete len:223 (-),score=54.51 TRINITY_DN9026_c0_g1_i1:5-673(-)